MFRKDLLTHHDCFIEGAHESFFINFGPYDKIDDFQKNGSYGGLR